MATTSAERKATERQRKRDKGFKPIEVWIHPDDEIKVRAYLKRLTAKH